MIDFPYSSSTGCLLPVLPRSHAIHRHDDVFGMGISCDCRGGMMAPYSNDIPLQSYCYLLMTNFCSVRHYWSIVNRLYSNSYVLKRCYHFRSRHMSYNLANFVPWQVPVAASLLLLSSYQVKQVSSYWTSTVTGSFASMKYGKELEVGFGTWAALSSPFALHLSECDSFVECFHSYYLRAPKIRQMSGRHRCC